MKSKKHIYGFSFLIILLVIPILYSCNSRENSDQLNEQVAVVLAHPDDETIISGTLAMLTYKGCRIQVIYVTSGDDGPDETGQGLHGESLSRVREQEAKKSLGAIGIKKPPVFLGFPDGEVLNHTKEIQLALIKLLNEIRPAVVISFGPDGITGSRDHIMTGFAADSAFNLTDSGRLLLHMAHTKSLVPISESGVDVAKRAIDLSVKVTGYTDERVHSFDAHYTQFPQRARTAYKVLVHTRRFEQFIIAGNRDADQLLQKCFNVKTLKRD
jgi:LmbE family N-acetylglucosaminyl deacetylase